MSTASFQRFDARGAVLWVNPELASAIDPLDLLSLDAFDGIWASEEPGPRGRAATALLQLTGRPERVHLRPLRHGGWLAPVWGDKVAGLGRARSESATTAALRAAGAPVPVPALVLGHRHGLLWRGAIGTLYEEDTVSGTAFLAASPPRGDSLRAARAAARAIRDFHDAGGRHADLHIGNLIVRDAGERCEVLIVDLDRACHASAPPAGRRMRELMRLYRSLRKRSLLEDLGRRIEVAFFEEYVGGDRALRAALLRHLPGEQRRIARHASAWRSPAR